MMYGATVEERVIEWYRDADGREHLYKWISLERLRQLLAEWPDDTPVWASPITGNLILSHPGHDLHYLDIANEKHWPERE